MEGELDPDTHQSELGEDPRAEWGTGPGAAHSTGE